MGWLTLAILTLATFGALVLLRVPRLLWTMVGAALMLGAAGYAWQGRPTLAAQYAKVDTTDAESVDGLIQLRTQMFGRYGADGAYLTAADAMARSGSPRYEVQTILGGIKGAPRSAMHLRASRSTRLSASRRASRAHASSLERRKSAPPTSWRRSVPGNRRSRSLPPPPPTAATSSSGCRCSRRCAR